MSHLHSLAPTASAGVRAVQVLQAKVAKQSPVSRTLRGFVATNAPRNDIFNKFCTRLRFVLCTLACQIKRLNGGAQHKTESAATLTGFGDSPGRHRSDRVFERSRMNRPESAQQTSPSVTGMDGRIPVVIGMAAEKSYLEHRPVRLSEITAPIPQPG